MSAFEIVFQRKPAVRKALNIQYSVSISVPG
jgi:hypothetical protein